MEWLCSQSEASGVTIVLSKWLGAKDPANNEGVKVTESNVMENVMLLKQHSKRNTNWVAKLRTKDRAFGVYSEDIQDKVMAVTLGC